MKPVKYQLKNGLTVLLAQSRKNPVISVQMWVRTGSADETPKNAGISHFIEHLLFKGTKQFDVGEIASTVEGAGGELNAYTSFDQTVFHVTIDSAQRAVALKVISEMMGYPRFDAEEIDREREVVIEEIKRGQDSPGRRSSQLMFSTFYKKHPYGRPVIGYEKIIRNVSVKEIKKYFQERYCTQNMFLLVSGDFDLPTMRQEVQQHFGDFKKNKIRKVSRAKESFKKTRLAVEKADFATTMLNLGWPIPNIQHRDVPALDVAALILGQGDSSRLMSEICLKKNLVQSIGSSAFTPLDQGLFVISAQLEEKNLEEVLANIEKEIILLAQEGPTKEELTKAVINLASETIYSLETVDGVARSVGHMEFYLKDPNAMKEYLKKVSSLTAEDIVKVIKKYILASPATSSIILTPGDAQKVKKQLQKFSLNFQKVKSKPFKKIGRPQRIRLELPKTTTTKSHVEVIPLKAGGKLILKEQSETPTTSVRIAFAGGAALEPQDLSGLNELMSRVWVTGTKDYSEENIHQELDAIASSLSAFSGRNTCGLNLDYLSQFEDRILSLAQSVLQQPTFEKDKIDRERDQMKVQIKRRNDHPSSVCLRAFTETLFEGHPYARDPMGTEQSLSLIQQADLLKQYKKIACRKNFLISVVGSFDKKKWINKAEELCSQLSEGEFKLQNISHQAPKVEIRKNILLQKEQSHFVMGMKGLSLTDPERWTLHVIQAILAGQGGRLFLELRDKHSLAYSVSPVMTEGVNTGSFGIYIGCTPEKVQKAEEMMFIELKKLVDEKVGESELERAQKYLCGSNTIQLQRKSSIATSILFDVLYGNKPEESLYPQDKYMKVTSEDIQKLAQKLFSQPKVFITVGPNKAA